MEKEQRKEILTREIIKKEIKDICVCNIKYALIPFLISLSFFFAFSHSTYNTNRKTSFLIIIAIIFFFALSIIILFIISFYFKLLTTVLRNDFSIITAKLIDKKQNGASGYYPLKASLNILFDPTFVLCFSSDKKYRVPMGKNYEWSQKHCMDHSGVFRSCDIGDEFYLIETNKGRVIYAYNTKLFELKD